MTVLKIIGIVVLVVIGVALFLAYEILSDPDTYR